MLASPKRIAVLPARLANQIAAGEVVERPASVIKELIENSVDAGATRIDIDLEQAGVRRLMVSDNGHGIHRDDLTLALARHATSKIQTIDDLAAIQSLGFRGEALASIASIARLTLSSRAVGAETAWSAFAEGHDMNVKMQPTALNTGTRVEVADLFYNTPARRRFLRSESTELQHIEEVVKRAALAAPQCGFFLRHNGKSIKQWRATSDLAERVRQVAGDSFAQLALPLQTAVEKVVITGFVAPASAHRAQTDLQFVFVNGRVIRDRVVQHALRAGFADLIPDGRAPAYVIYISMPATDVDVNVHPTKHEVRFRHARWMHDLLTATIAQLLTNDVATPAYSPSTPFKPIPAATAIAEQRAFYQTITSLPADDLAADAQSSHDFVRLTEQFVLLRIGKQWCLCDAAALLEHWLREVLSSSPLRPLMWVNELPPVSDELRMSLRLKTKEDGKTLLSAPACLADCDWHGLLASWRPEDVLEHELARHLRPRLRGDGKTVQQLLTWLTQKDLATLPVKILSDDVLRGCLS